MMSPRLAATTFTKLVILAAVLFLGTAALLSAQAGWKPLKDRGYSFSYPTGIASTWAGTTTAAPRDI